MSNIKFTKEEAAYIDKKLGPIIFHWAKSLIDHILTQARDKGVEVVYINTPESLDAGGINEGKTLYFYDKLPPMLGFKKESVNLRQKGQEMLWAYRFDEVKAHVQNILLKLAKQFSLQEIPKKYQGAFIGILGRKDFYTENEVKQVLGIVEKKAKKPKSTSTYYYDWDSTTWSGAQSFNKNIKERVVLQKMTSEMQGLLNEDPVLRKFWAYILSQSQHFGTDVIGFALVSKISPKIWVINEIQTDCINHYMEMRREALMGGEQQKEEGDMPWETLRDMLTAQNRSKWITKCEMNEQFKRQLMQNPDMINQLPDDTQDIDQWISDRQSGEQDTTMGLDLIEHFQSVNFNTKIFKLY